MARAAVAPDVRAEEVRREQVFRQYRELSKAAPESLAAHAALFHKDAMGHPIVPKRHHQEWIRILQDRETFRWVVIIAPPGYAKSSWISMAYTSWRVGQARGKLRVGVVSGSGSLAEGFGASIREAIEHPMYSQIYGIKPDTKKGWNMSEMWTTGAVDPANPNVHCVGMGGTVQGKRYDEIILDDPSDWDDVRSPTIMEGQRFFVKTTLLERYPPGYKPPDGLGRMVVVMTRWGDQDLVETFRELGFKIITMPALGYWDKKAVCPDCGEERNPGLYELLQRCEHCQTGVPPEITWGEEPLWPEQESKHTLLKQRDEDPIIFDLVKQGDPKALSGNVFDVSKIQRAPMPDRSSFEKVVQYVDSAGGKDRKKGDYFVIGTLGLRKQGQEVWAIDCFRDRLPAPEQENKVIEKGRDTFLRPDRVFIEMKNEGIALYQRLIISRDARLPLQQVTPEKDKEFRAIPLANVVNAGRFFVPTYPNGEPYPWVRQLEIEMAAFPGGRHDDQVDSFAGGYREIADNPGPRIRVLRAGMA